MGFVEKLLNHTKEYESPESFWRWSAYVAIAGVLRDNVHVLDGDSKLFPNIYCLFLAGSAARKGRPVNLCEQILQEVGNTKIISGRASIQAILDELNHGETDSKTGKVIKGGSAVFFAPELSAGLVEDTAATGILTDIYDGKTNFKNLLRHSPKFKVDRIVFSAFMASNEALIRAVFDIRANQGGLLGRTFLIVPDEFRASNSLMRATDKSDSLRDIITELKEVAKLTGTFSFSEEAIDEYESWYIPFRDSYKTRKDPGGVAGRIHTSIKKLSIILAANDGEPVIRKIHIQRAIHESISLLPNYNTLIMSSGKSSMADAATTILQELSKAEGYAMPRSRILANHAFDFDSETLDKISTTFQEAGFIEMAAGGDGLWYKLTKKGIDMVKGGNP